MSEWKGSDNGYGLLNTHDIVLLQYAVTMAALRFGTVKLLEVGTCGGYTALGISKFCDSRGYTFEYHGIDGACGAPHPGTMPKNYTFWMGDSAELFESMTADGFSVLFIDACHCSNHVMLDFLNYSPKVMVGGYVLFHDTNPSPRWNGVHDNHWQGHGPNTPAFNIAVRAGLKKLGLLDGQRADYAFVSESSEGDALGMMVFQKLRAL